MEANLAAALRELVNRLSGKQWARDRRETLVMLGHLIDDVEQEFHRAGSGFSSTNEAAKQEPKEQVDASQAEVQP